jgi:thymidylate synthase ThyX
MKEMNEIGEMLKQEAGKVLPSLMRYADKKRYFTQTEEDMTALAKTISVLNANPEPVTLAKAPSDPGNMVIASILYRYKQEPFSKIMEKVKSMPRKEKAKIFDTYLKNMGDFDYPMRELEHLQFTFDIIIDYGAFRDLQRHRICTQTNQLLTTDMGYDVPKDIINAGVESQYRRAMEQAKALYDKLKDKYPLQAQYLLPLGFRKRFLLTMNLREVYHFVKLRTVPFAHESYRLIAYKLYEIMRKKYPLLSKYIVCNYTKEELGRLKSEEKTEKMKTVGPL